MTDIVEELRDSISAARYSADSVLASLAATLGLSILLFCLFLVLRRRIQTLYASKPIGNAQMYPYPGNGLFDWIKPVYNARLAKEIQPRLGLDAAVYLRFIRMLRNIFIGLAVFGCGVGIPVNVYFNWRSATTAQQLSKQDAFILMTPTLVSGTPMAAHVAVGWVCNTIIVLNLYFAYRWILNLRRDHYSDYTHRRETVNRTVLAVDLERRDRCENGIASLVGQFLPQARPLGATIGRDVRHLEELLAQHKSTIISLEKAILKEEKDRKNGKYVPAAATSNSSPQYWTRIKDDLEARIGQERRQCRKEHKRLSYGFVSYPTQNMAHQLAKAARGKSVENAHIRLAPALEDIIWPTIALGVHKRRSMRLWINLIYTAFLILWIIPVAALGCFASNFKRIGVLWPAFAYQMATHPTAFAILQGIVAPTITALIFALVPVFTRKLSKWEGSLTRTDREKEVIRKLFVLFFLINFFSFTFMGVVWDIIAEVISIVHSGKGTSFEQVWNELKLSQRLITAIIDISSFWVMYLLRSISELFTSLAQVLSLVMRTWQQAFTKVTPRDRLNWIDPEPFPYATSYIWAAFYTAIALALTTIQPLVLAITAIYFTVALPFKKYELMYMYYTKYESHGLFWPLVHNIIVFSTVFGNLVLLCLVWVQASWQLAMGVAPLPVLIIIYKIFAYYAFDRHYWFFIDSRDDEKLHQEYSIDDKLEDIYENPVLYKPLDRVIVDRPEHIKEHKAGMRSTPETHVAPGPTYDSGSSSGPDTVDNNTLAETIPEPRPFDDHKYADGLYDQPPSHPHEPQYPSPYPSPYTGFSPTSSPSPYTGFSPTSCPYPERAMCSTASLVNDSSFRDDQELLNNDSLGYDYVDEHEFELQGTDGREHPTELSNMYQHPNGSTGLQYHGLR